MNTTEKNKLNELENILSFLGIEFIDYKGHRTSNGHKTAKNVGQIKDFFGKDVMTSGQFIQDIHGWKFETDWNDLMFLVQKIKEHLHNSMESRSKVKKVLDTLWRLNKEETFEACVEFIEWFNSQKK